MARSCHGRCFLGIACFLLSLPLCDSFLMPSVLLRRGIAERQLNSLSTDSKRMPTRLDGAISITCSGTLSRKDKNRQKKQQKLQENAVKREFQQKRDVLIDELLDEIAEDKRDVQAIARSIEQLRALSPAGQIREALCGDWKLLYVNSADALHNFGTGLGKLPGTTIIDAWLTMTPEGRVKVNEICRVIGPFPNIQNILEGTWDYRDRPAVAGFAPAAGGKDNIAAVPGQTQTGLKLSYSQLTDGRGKVTTADTGFRARDLVLNVAFWSSDVLILDSDSNGPLVWEREDQLDKEMGRLLRVDLTAPAGQQQPAAGLIEGIAQIATAAKKPWDFFKK